MGVNQETEQLVKRDNISHKIGQLKPKGMLSGTECVVTRCTIKDENKLMKEQVKESDRQMMKLKKELEYFYDNLEKEIDLDPGKKKELLEKAVQTREVQIQYKIVMEMKERITQLENRLEKVNQEYAEYKQDQDRIMTNFQADAKIQEKVKLINALKDKYNRMTLTHDKLQTEIDKADIQYKHLAENYNSLLEEYQLMRSKAKQMKTIVKKGTRLLPLKEIEPGKIRKRKRIWGILDIIVRN